MLLVVRDEDKVVVLVDVLHLGVDGGVVGHCFGEFCRIAVADRICGCQSLKEMSSLSGSGSCGGIPAGHDCT